MLGLILCSQLEAAQCWSLEDQNFEVTGILGKGPHGEGIISAETKTLHRTQLLKLTSTFCWSRKMADRHEEITPLDPYMI